MGKTERYCSTMINRKHLIELILIFVPWAMWQYASVQVGGVYSFKPNLLFYCILFPGQCGGMPVYREGEGGVYLNET